MPKSVEALEVIARPEFEKQDLAWLMDIRRKRTGNLGPPRFTLAFPGAMMDHHDFTEFVRARVNGVQRIRFCLRSAVVVPEVFVRCFHVFLVPDEGFGAIVRLHDRLHVGPLEACLRPETPYLPHITVATDRHFPAARKIAADINAGEVSITGVIDTIQTERRDGAVVRLSSEIHLAQAGWFG